MQLRLRCVPLEQNMVRTRCASGQVFFLVALMLDQVLFDIYVLFLCKKGFEGAKKLPESSGNDSRIIPSCESMGTPLLRDD